MFKPSIFLQESAGVQHYFMIKERNWKHSETADLLGRGRSLLSYIAHCKNVEPWLWKTTPPPLKKKMFWIITCITIWVCYHYYGVFFAHLLILQYPDHHWNLISSSLYYSGPLHKISSQTVHNFLSNVVHRQTNKQTDKPTSQHYQKHNLLCQGGNKQTNKTLQLHSCEYIPVQWLILTLTVLVTTFDALRHFETG